MPAAANPQMEQRLAPPQLPQIAAVCEKHRLAHGSPRDLAAFLHALDRNKLLAMDFWSVVARIVETDASNASHPDWLLATVVEAITGGTVAQCIDADPLTAPLVDNVTRILAGEDLDNPLANTPFPPARELDLSMLRSRGFKATRDREPPAALQPASSAIPWPVAPSRESPRRSLLLAFVSEESGAALAQPSRQTILALALTLCFIAVSGWLRLHHHAVIAQQSISAASPPVASKPASAQTTLTTPTPAVMHIPAPAAVVPLTVPASLMQQYLASSRVPIYSKTARAARLDAPLIIEAIINKDGSVSHPRVRSGDSALRPAALASVATWRYRPYLVHDRPVAVLTTIAVDVPGND
jgi:outer membrane biosynthesis protein TonB